MVSRKHIITDKEKLIENLQKSDGYLLSITAYNLKMYLDFYGEEKKESLIKAFSEALLQIEDVLEDFQLYRFCGEFYGTTKSIGVKDLFKIKEIFDNKKIDLYGVKLWIPLIIGISEVKERPYKAMDFAKRAMRRAKITNLSHLYYEKDEGVEVEMLNEVQAAINEGRILPYFQAIANKDKEIVKYEALVRLISRQGDVVPPGDFLDIAKKFKLYTRLTKIVFRDVLRKIRETQKRITINLSYLDMKNEHLKKHMIRTISRFEYPHMLEFEITETEDINDVSSLKDFIEECRKYGVKFALDDFGSGFNTFAHILNFDLDYIKIDGSLIKQIGEDRHYRVINAIVEFAKEIDIETVAEFVSSEEIFNKCKDLGIDYMQGYYIGRPEESL